MTRKTHTPTRRPLPASDASPTDLWFVAYDIGHPKRLRQVHRCVRREGVALQYSGFAVAGDADDLQALLARLAGIIDTRADDVRAYHLPARCQVWGLGRQGWPDGLTLTGNGALLQLLSTAGQLADVAAEPEVSNAAQAGTTADTMTAATADVFTRSVRGASQ